MLRYAVLCLLLSIGRSEGQSKEERDPAQELTVSASVAMGAALASTKTLISLLEANKPQDATLAKELEDLAEEMEMIAIATETLLYDLSHTDYPEGLAAMASDHLKLGHNSVDLARASNVALIGLNAVKDVDQHDLVLGQLLAGQVGQQTSLANSALLSLNNLNVWDELMDEHKYETDSNNRFVKRLYDAEDELSTPLSETECKQVCQDEKMMTGCRISCKYV